MLAHLSYPHDTLWTFHNLQNPGYEPTLTLGLHYALNNSAMSDDYDAAETSARELWDLYLRRNGNGNPGWGYAPGTVHIHWFVDNIIDSDGDGVFEVAPFQTFPPDPVWESGTNEDFLTFFSWPTNSDTDEPLNWARLPVLDQQWTPRRADKGGFIQQVTGWKPAALQATVNLHQLARAASLPIPTALQQQP